MALKPMKKKILNRLLVAFFALIILGVILFLVNVNSDTKPSLNGSSTSIIQSTTSTPVIPKGKSSQIASSSVSADEDAVSTSTQGYMFEGLITRIVSEISTDIPVPETQYQVSVYGDIAKKLGSSIIISSYGCALDRSALGLLMFSGVTYNAKYGWYNCKSAPPISKYQITDYQYAADFSDDKVLVGASHNIFVGKVVRQIGTKDLGIGPETQFEVDVIDNIKGDLKGTVTVDEQGGYENGTLYVVDDDTASTAKDGSGYLLQTGSTYLLATRYNSNQDWYTLNSYPTASKLLSSDANVPDASLVALAESDPRVQQLKAAYPNEILLDADVAHHNTLNSYASVQAAEADQAENSLATSTDDLTSTTSTDQMSTSSTSILSEPSSVATSSVIEATDTQTVDDSSN